MVTLWMATRTRSASLKLLRAVIDAIPQGLAYFDAEDRFVLGNDAYRRDIAAAGVQLEAGLTYAEMMGRAADGLTVPEATGRQQAWVDDVVKRRALDVDSRDQQTLDGRFLRVQNNRARGGGLVTVVSDITGLKRQTRELAAARDAAEAAARAKDDFLTNMSHELRTPMNGVIGVAELLANEPLTPRQAELVDLIRGSSETLNGLICDILDLVKVKSGVMEITDAPFDLHLTIESTRTMFDGQARLKGPVPSGRGRRRSAPPLHGRRGADQTDPRQPPLQRGQVHGAGRGADDRRPNRRRSALRRHGHGASASTTR